MAREATDIFGILVRHLEGALHAFVEACVHDPASADDVVQETFIAAWQSLDRLDEKQRFAAWLRGIAKNKILEHFRSVAAVTRKVEPLTESVLDQVAEQFALLGVDRPEALDGRLLALRECLASLQEQDRNIIDRHYRLKEKCTAIATHVTLSVSAVRKRLQRARLALYDCVTGKLEAETTRD